MGCHIQKQRRVADSQQTLEESVKSDYLTDRQRHLVKRTWRILADDMTGRGIMIFMRVFEKHPDLQEIFPFRETPKEVLLRDPRFRGHGSRFMQAVGAAVDNISDWEGSLSPFLVELGKQHARTTGFESKFFATFADIMIEVWRQELGRKLTPEVEKAWRIIFTFLVEKLHHGYMMIKNTEGSGEKDKGAVARSPESDSDTPVATFEQATTDGYAASSYQ